MGFTGDNFTWWNNSHTGDDYIREQLDKAVADAAWCSCFPSVRVKNGDPRHSDHRPVIVTMDEDSELGRSSSGPQFRFEANWVQEENCEAVVENAWRLAMEGRSRRVLSVVHGVAADLWDWSRNILGDMEKRIKFTKKALEACRKKENNK